MGPVQKNQSTSRTPQDALLAIAYLITLVLLAENPAHAYCYKPTPPYRPYTFTSDSQVDSYNRSVDAYNSQLESYKRCLSQSYDSYERRFREYLQCEARSFGKQYSGCMRPSPPP